MCCWRGRLQSADVASHTCAHHPATEHHHATYATADYDAANGAYCALRGHMVGVRRQLQEDIQHHHSEAR